MFGMFWFGVASKVHGGLSDQSKRRVNMAIKSLEKDENGQARFFGCSNIRDFQN
jgi:hypothetical protein